VEIAGAPGREIALNRNKIYAAHKSIFYLPAGRKRCCFGEWLL
jgi:hypothetical protein